MANKPTDRIEAETGRLRAKQDKQAAAAHSDPDWQPQVDTVPSRVEDDASVEEMLRACVPGGDIVDPQLVADNIREWCKKAVDVVPSRVEGDDRHKPITDIDRLDYLLKWITVDDIGDYTPCPGVVVDSEAIEDALSYGPPMEDGRRPCLCDWSDDMRSVIDKAINSRSIKVERPDDYEDVLEARNGN